MVLAENISSFILLGFILVIVIVDVVFFDKDSRDGFIKTYKKLDEYDPDRDIRPKSKTLIILSLIGLIGSLFLGIYILSLVFLACLIVFVFHWLIMRD